jgi:abequosyltransferase
MNINADAEFDLGNEHDRLRYFGLAETTTAFFSFMSSLIVKKSRWDAIPLDDDFVGNLWAHVARIFRMIPQGLCVKYISESLLDKRVDNDSFMEKGLVYRYMQAVGGYHRLADTFFGRTSSEASHIRRVIRNEFPPFRVLLNLKLGAKKSGNLQDLALLDQLAEKVYGTSTFSDHIMQLVYKHMPLGVYKALRATYCTVKPYIRRQA